MIIAFKILLLYILFFVTICLKYIRDD